MSFDTLYKRYFRSPRRKKNYVKYDGKGRLADCLSNSKTPVPKERGVYVFEGPKGLGHVVYVGKAGTFNGTTNEYDKQGLRDRIKNKQSKNELREPFLKRMIKKEKWPFVRIRWYSCVAERDSRVPAKIEADLIQAFLDDRKRLPKWNLRF